MSRCRPRRRLSFPRCKRKANPSFGLVDASTKSKKAQRKGNRRRLFGSEIVYSLAWKSALSVMFFLAPFLVSVGWRQKSDQCNRHTSGSFSGRSGFRPGSSVASPMSSLFLRSVHFCKPVRPLTSPFESRYGQKMSHGRVFVALLFLCAFFLSHVYLSRKTPVSCLAGATPVPTRRFGPGSWGNAWSWSACTVRKKGMFNNTSAPKGMSCQMHALFVIKATNPAIADEAFLARCWSGSLPQPGKGEVSSS